MGYLLGGGVSLAFLATFLFFLMSFNDPYLDDSPGYSIVWLLAIPVAGYVAAMLAAVLRSTRRVGQGMLIGLTLMLLVAIGAAYGIGVSNSP